MPTGRPQTGVGGSVWYQSAGVSVCRQNSRRRRQRLQVVEAELKANPEGDDEGELKAELKAEGGTQRGTQTQTEHRRTQTSPSQGGTQTNVRRLKTERDAVSRQNADERRRMYGLKAERRRTQTQDDDVSKISGAQTNRRRKMKGHVKGRRIAGAGRSPRRR